MNFDEWWAEQLQGTQGHVAEGWARAAWQAACAEKDAQINGLTAQREGSDRALREAMRQNTQKAERITELEDQIAQRVRERDVAHDLIEAARVRIAELEAEVTYLHEEDDRATLGLLQLQAILLGSKP